LNRKNEYSNPSSGVVNVETAKISLELVLLESGISIFKTCLEIKYIFVARIL
jgi:hypothetical protein